MKTSPFSVMDAPYPGDVYIPNRQRAAWSVHFPEVVGATSSEGFR